MIQIVLILLLIGWFYTRELDHTKTKKLHRISKKKKKMPTRSSTAAMASTRSNKAAQREASRLTSSGICPINDDDYSVDARKLKRYSDREFPVLRRLGLYASEIEGDGNCLFRALSDQLYGDKGAMHPRIRSQVVEYMKQNSAYFSMFLGSEFGESWEQYLSRMARDGVYGDNAEIVAFANCYGVNVVIYQQEHLFVVACQDGSHKAMNVHIAYHDWEHYSSVRNREGPHRGLPDVKPSEPVEASSAAEIPPWKIKVVKESLPQPVSDEEVKRALKDQGGEVSNAVEALLMAEYDNDSSATAVTDDSRSIQTLDGGSEQQYNTSPASSTNSSSNNKNNKRLTAREKKEKQKREAAERKRNNKKAAADDPMKQSLSCSDIKAMYI